VERVESNVGRRSVLKVALGGGWIFVDSEAVTMSRIALAFKNDTVPFEAKGFSGVGDTAVVPGIQG